MKRKSFTNYKKAGQDSKKAYVPVLPYRKPIMYAKRNVSLQPEMKYFDTTGTYSVDNAANWTGSEVTCNNYVQDDGTTIGAYTDSALIPSANGPGYGEVLGGKYQIRKIRIRGNYFTSSLTGQTTVQAGSFMRLVLCMDVNAGGAQLQGEQVFTDLGSADACCLSFQQQGQATDKYRVLRDIRIHSNPTVAGTDAANTFAIGFERVPFEFTYVPKDPLVVSVLTSGATPAVAQLKDINIFMLARSSLDGILTFACRVYYTDS